MRNPALRMYLLCLLLAQALLLPGRVSSHGSMTFPRPRNALDAHLAPWSSWSSPPSEPRFSANGLDTAGACPITTGTPNMLKSNGQSCYWVRFPDWARLAAGLAPACVARRATDRCVYGCPGAQFSNGCTIGCPRCDGSSDHFGHGSAGTPAPVLCRVRRDGIPRRRRSWPMHHVRGAGLDECRQNDRSG
jgi:hypothetical protein